MDDNRLHASWMVMLLIWLVVSQGVRGFKLIIMHTNEFSSRFQEYDKGLSSCPPEAAQKGKCYGGSARLKSKINEIRETYDNSLLLDAGSQYQGSLLFYVHGGEVTGTMMSVLGYDAMTFGYHEFDRYTEGLKPLLDNIDFPIVSTNMDMTNEQTLRAVKQSVIKDMSGTKVAIVGYSDPAIVEHSYTDKVIVRDIEKALKEEIKSLKAKGVKIIVAIGHASYETNMDLASRIDGLDVVVGGLGKTLLYKGKPPLGEREGPYPTVVDGNGERKVLVVHGSGFGQYLGFLEVEFDSKGKAESWNGNPILMDNKIGKDHTVLDEIQEFLPKVEDMIKSQVGESLVYLEAYGTACSLRECNLGNFLADAFVHQSLKHLTSHGGEAYIGFIHTGTIQKEVIPKGSITGADIAELLPYMNTIDRIEITGEVLEQVMENSASEIHSHKSSFEGFLQVSGVKVVYDSRRKKGHRVKRLEVICVDCTPAAYVPVVKNQTYKVLMPSFIMTGGNGYTMLKEAAAKTREIGQVDNELIMHYLKERSPVAVGLEGRIHYLHSFNFKATQFCTKDVVVKSFFSSPTLIALVVMTILFICASLVWFFNAEVEL